MGLAQKGVGMARFDRACRQLGCVAACGARSKPTRVRRGQSNERKGRRITALGVIFVVLIGCLVPSRPTIRCIADDAE
jgi:hypothetical protein